MHFAEEITGGVSLASRTPRLRVNLTGQVCVLVGRCFLELGERCPVFLNRLTDDLNCLSRFLLEVFLVSGLRLELGLVVFLVVHFHEAAEPLLRGDAALAVDQIDPDVDIAGLDALGRQTCLLFHADLIGRSEGGANLLGQITVRM